MVLNILFFALAAGVLAFIVVKFIKSEKDDKNTTSTGGDTTGGGGGIEFPKDNIK